MWRWILLLYSFPMTKMNLKTESLRKPLTLSLQFKTLSEISVRRTLMKKESKVMKHWTKMKCRKLKCMYMAKERRTQNMSRSLTNLEALSNTHSLVPEHSPSLSENLEDLVVTDAWDSDLGFTLSGSYFSNTMEKLLEKKDSTLSSWVSLSWLPLILCYSWAWLVISLALSLTSNLLELHSCWHTP